MKQITIQLQGTRHSSHDSVVQQLEIILARLRTGETTGASHDDGFGYQFQVVEGTGPSFFLAASRTALAHDAETAGLETRIRHLERLVSDLRPDAERYREFIDCGFPFPWRGLLQ